MTLLETYSHFETDFKSFYDKFYKEIGVLYVNGEVSNEPMPKLKARALKEVLNVIHGCLTRSNYEEHEVCWFASYIAIHIATRQILDNGNKRLSLLVLCFFLNLYGIRLVFEREYYAGTIKDLIENADKEKSRDLYIEKYIEVFANEIVNNSVNVDDAEEGISESVLGRFPF